jgi:hypothetical protein
LRGSIVSDWEGEEKENISLETNIIQISSHSWMKKYV